MDKASKFLARFVPSLMLAIVFFFSIWLLLIMLLACAVVLLGHPADRFALWLITSQSAVIGISYISSGLAFIVAWKIMKDDSEPIVPADTEKIEKPCEEWAGKINELICNGESSEELTSHLAECPHCEKKVADEFHAAVKRFEEAAQYLRRNN
jgi:hypothetical protein